MFKGYILYTHFVCQNGIKIIMDSHLIFSILKIWQETLCFIMLSTIESMGKVIHPKYYKHLKKGAHQSHLDKQKMGWFLAN